MGPLEVTCPLVTPFLEIKPWMTKFNAITDWRAGGPTGSILGPMLPRIVLSQLVLIKLGKFFCHSSTQAGRQWNQFVLPSFCQDLSEKEASEKHSEIKTRVPRDSSSGWRVYFAWEEAWDYSLIHYGP